MFAKKVRILMILVIATSYSPIWGQSWPEFFKSLNTPKHAIAAVTLVGIGGGLMRIFDINNLPAALKNTQLKIANARLLKLEQEQAEKQRQHEQMELRKKNAIHKTDKVNRDYSSEFMLFPARVIENEIYNPNKENKERFAHIIKSKFNKSPFNSYYDALVKDLHSIHEDQDTSLFEKECQRIATTTNLQSTLRAFNAYFAAEKVAEEKIVHEALKVKEEERRAQEKGELELQLLRAKVKEAENVAANKTLLEQINHKMDLENKTRATNFAEMRAYFGELKQLFKKNQIVNDNKQSEIKNELKGIKELANKPATPTVITVKVPETPAHNGSSAQPPAYNPEYTAAGNSGNLPLYPVLTPAIPSAPPLGA